MRNNPGKLNKTTIMKKLHYPRLAMILAVLLANTIQVEAQATNPVIYADVPDMSITRVDKNY